MLRNDIFMCVLQLFDQRLANAERERVARLELLSDSTVVSGEYAVQPCLIVCVRGNRTSTRLRPS